MTRGEINNNPLNIRISNQSWLGKKDPSGDDDFEQFDTVEHGIRAGAKIILTYYYHGIDTIEGIIERWAPPVENPTGNYAYYVAKVSGYQKDAHLMLTSLDDLWPVIKGMIHFENGECIYPEDVIKSGCQMALGTKESNDV